MRRPLQGWPRAGWAALRLSVAGVLLGYSVGEPAAGSRLAARQPPGPPVLVFQGATIIDVTNGERQPDQTVVIVGNRIQSIGPARAGTIPAGAHIVDARGKYLIPGLWDMHSHALQGADSLSWAGAIVAGVMGAREAAVSAWDQLRKDKQSEALQEVLAGVRAGPPRQVYGSPFVSTQGLDSAGVRAIVDSAKAGGFFMVKTFGDRTVSDRDRALYFYLVNQARRAGLGVGGHLVDMDAPSALEASDSGLTIIDHAPSYRQGGGIDRFCLHTDMPWARPKFQRGTLAACQRAAARLRRNGTWVVFNSDDYSLMSLNARTWRILWATGEPGSCAQPARDWLRAAARFTPPAGWGSAGAPADRDSLLEWARTQSYSTPPASDSSHFFDLVFRAGLPLLVGSHGRFAYLHTYLAFLVSEGFSPLAALQTVTLNAAQSLHATDSLGTVAAGKLADLVLLDADPLADITNTTTIEAVVANGHYYDRAALDRLTAEGAQCAV